MDAVRGWVLPTGGDGVHALGDTLCCRCVWMPLLKISFALAKLRVINEELILETWSIPDLFGF